ncbi:MAG: hypothetical protein HC888_00095 [Candidatus Competibacteraceae bacterium]|nr:hypothetical protein [Candidatus Competibacteraceae bacterium]
MKPLNVKRYRQDPSHCAIASSGSIANFYNKNIDYEYAKAVAYSMFKDISNGLYSAQVGLLLNNLGFESVTLVSSDLFTLDYSWSSLTRRQMVNRFEAVKKRRNLDAYGIDRENIKSFSEFLRADHRDNSLVIGYNFADFICDAIDRQEPIIITYNWTMYFKYPKTSADGTADPLGDYTEHAVVARGYDKEGVFIVDSHHREYVGRLKKFVNGYYKMSWDHLLSCMGQGDVIIPRRYNPDLVKQLSDTSRTSPEVCD